MSEPIRNLVDIGPASEEDIFYKEMSRELAKADPATIRDTLQRLITLDTSLLGGSFFLFSSSATSPAFPAWSRALTLGLFLLSLGIAVLGINPIPAKAPFYDVNAFAKNHYKQLDNKRSLIRWSVVCLLLGLISAGVGVLLCSPH
jgi:hypothetical protein